MCVCEYPSITEINRSPHSMPGGKMNKTGSKCIKRRQPNTLPVQDIIRFLETKTEVSPYKYTSCHLYITWYWHTEGRRGGVRGRWILKEKDGNFEAGCSADVLVPSLCRFSRISSLVLLLFYVYVCISFCCFCSLFFFFLSFSLRSILIIERRSWLRLRQKIRLIGRVPWCRAVAKHSSSKQHRSN